MQINWEKWVKDGGDTKWQPLRQAIHIVLISVEKCDSLKNQMMLKGGILMALCYDSSRYTKDIDFSQTVKYEAGDEGKLLAELESAIQDTVQDMDYGLDCRIQSSELKPRNLLNPTFPVLNLKIGYAYNHDTRQHRRLLEGQVPTVVEIDFSFNETTKSVEEFQIAEGKTLLRYSLIDLVAEKFRALLQQEVRNRYRRQDLYDLHLLINQIPEQLNPLRSEILSALQESCKSKELEISQNSMNGEVIRTRTHEAYELLAAEVEEGTLVEFDLAYEKVMSFYKSLPWYS
ncbi:nucleotidyl transferase AbiEii/AbiGii toxin family protein [Methyloradius palustris]|nr:nucleotidyl transferase AbiEii/AbiGii toxin family protein [Methyloradius palustris]